MAGPAATIAMFWLALPWLCPEPPPAPDSPGHPPAHPIDIVEPDAEPAASEQDRERARALEAQVARLPGQKVARVERHGLLIDYAIDDIAGAGAPFVGRIVQRSNRAGLDLVTTDGRRFQLQGPLARAHLAGPGYKVWIVGDAAGRLLRILRIGILATP